MKLVKMIEKNNINHIKYSCQTVTDYIHIKISNISTNISNIDQIPIKNRRYFHNEIPLKLGQN